MSTHLPLISCIMPTYGRPLYVPEAVWCFTQQDYPHKELIILNDCAEQEYDCDLPGVKVVNLKDRFATLGEKRDACIELSNGEVIAIWDDDDISLPWRLSLTWQEMQRRQTPFYRSAEFLAYWGESFLHDNQTIPGWVSHGITSFTKQLWQDVGGYPRMDVGEDAKFFERIHQFLGEEFIAYPILRHDRYYVLRGKSAYSHMSMIGGENPLDTKGGVFNLEPREISDPLLARHVERVCQARRLKQMA